MTKALHRKIDTRRSWGSVLSLDMDSIEELKLNSRSLLFNSQLPTRLIIRTPVKAAVLRTFQLMVHPCFMKIGLRLNADRAPMELKCIHYALQSFQHMLSSHTVKWFTDNQAVKSMIDSGSMKVHLHKLAVDIFLLC